VNTKITKIWKKCFGGGEAGKQGSWEAGELGGGEVGKWGSGEATPQVWPVTDLS